jgi:hypothetical protein
MMNDLLSELFSVRSIYSFHLKVGSLFVSPASLKDDTKNDALLTTAHPHLQCTLNREIQVAAPV